MHAPCGIKRKQVLTLPVYTCVPRGFLHNLKYGLMKTQREATRCYPAHCLQDMWRSEDSNLAMPLCGFCEHNAILCGQATLAANDVCPGSEARLWRSRQRGTPPSRAGREHAPRDSKQGPPVASGGQRTPMPQRRLFSRSSCKCPLTTSHA
jgi:hypothetical protein